MTDNWEKRIEVQKGNKGEAIIRAALMKAGWFPYKPDFDGPHPVDRVAFNPKQMAVVLFDSKCKAARRVYPDTGFNVTHFDRYTAWNKKIPVFVGFVDEGWGRVYGDFLDRLIVPQEPRRRWFGKTYPSVERGVVFFPLTNMRMIGYLEDSARAEIGALCQSKFDGGFKYEFPPIPDFLLAGEQ